MACILNIETSTDVCSVAVSDELQTVWHEECFERANHAEQLPVYIETALYHLHREGLRLDAVAVSEGPGSYTGLRIGVSTAKGVCYGNDVPLIAVPTLDILTVPVLLNCDIEDDALLCPMIDARRMEVYAKICDKSMNTLRETSADIIDGDSYGEFLNARKVYFFGNGVEKCKSVIVHPNARFIDNILPVAANMQPLSDKKYNAGQFVDTAYFTPFYLKDFRATVPKKIL